jgi:hypothetical protein
MQYDSIQYTTPLCFVASWVSSLLTALGVTSARIAVKIKGAAFCQWPYSLENRDF